ncbi:uncharacterized protein At3g49055-like [Nicotiana sylvestris]|uniref:uncharacterized protein At3g49055-like n=1 Tax=Nicotiana sylvestris TaxID=4096 RepID=UPI00388CD0C3
MGHSPSLPSFSKDTMNEARALRAPDQSRVPGEEDPFWDYFTGIDDAADLNDVSTLFEEDQRLFSRAITKFKADLSQCEVELKNSSDEEKALRPLYSQKEEELKDLQAYLVKTHRNEAELGKQVTVILKDYGILDLNVEANTSMSQLQQILEMIGQLRGEVDQIRGAKVKNLAQAKKIKELEAKLAEVEAEAAEARAGVERMKANADKTIYLRDAKDVQEELREASEQEKRSNDLDKC